MSRRPPFRRASAASVLLGCLALAACRDTGAVAPKPAIYTPLRVLAAAKGIAIGAAAGGTFHRTDSVGDSRSS